MSEERALPPDWVERVSKKRGRKYYFNVKTLESSWEFPEEGNVKRLRRKTSESDTSDAFFSPTSDKEKSLKRKKPLICNSETSSIHSHKSKPRNKHKKLTRSISSKCDRTKGDKSAAENITALKPVAEQTKNAILKDLPKHSTKGKEVRVAQWISTVNQNFEPSEQESVKDESCDASSETDFDSVIDKYVHNARVGSEVLAPRRTTSDDYVPLLPTANQKKSSSSEDNLKHKVGSSTERIKGPPSTCQGDRLSSSATNITNCMAPLPNISPSSSLLHSQRSPVESSGGTGRPCNTSPPVSCCGFSNSSSMFSKNVISSDTSQVQAAVTQQQEFRSTPLASRSSSKDTKFGFFKPRDTSPIAQPLNRVLCTASVPMMVDSNPAGISEKENMNRSAVLGSSVTNIPPRHAACAVNHSNSSLTPGYASIDSGCVLFSEEAVGMEIDYNEELEEHIRQELQMVRSEFMVDAVKVQETALQGQQLAAQHSYKDTLYIILDTNVLLSHLKFVSELKDYPVEGTGRPVLVVPWIVLQELDSLKSDAWKIKQGKIVMPQNKNGVIGIDSLARQAIKFLHSCFENKHPRVRGQTLAEFSEEMNTFPDESNDDRILQCCLLFKKKADKGHAVLFSNDQNLCNKALVNGIKAFNHQTLVGGLKELFKSSALVPLTQDSFTEFYDQLRKQEELADKRAKADDIMCELQCVMREGLSVVMETEMRAAYDNLWETIVFIKPPWTLRDLIQCLIKHWIAVYGHVLSRDTKHVVEELKKHFDLEKGVPGCLANVTKILTLAQKLFDDFAVKSSYGGAITKCVAAIMVLQKKCNDYQLVTLPSPTSPNCAPGNLTPHLSPRQQNFPAIQQSNAVGTAPRGTENAINGGKEIPQNGEASDDHLETASLGSSVRTKISTSFVHSQPHALVLKTFDVIWNAVTQFSAQIFSALQYPNPLPVNILENLPRPSRDEAILFLGRLCPCLSAVIAGIQSVLRTPLENPEDEQQAFEDCVRAVRQFLQEILSTESSMTVGDLCVFCQDPSTRDGLIKGTSQLDRALATLQHCSSCVAASNLP